MENTTLTTEKILSAIVNSLASGIMHRLERDDLSLAHVEAFYRGIELKAKFENIPPPRQNCL